VDLHPSRLLAHLSSPLKGTLKLNVDGSFLEGSGCLGGSGVVRNHDEDLTVDFSHNEIGGDALLVVLCVIETTKTMPMLFVRVIA